MTISEPAAPPEYQVESAMRERVVARFLRPFQRFFSAEATGGIVLLTLAVAGLAWANSPWSASYFHLWERPLPFGFSGGVLPKSLHGWINDGLMAVFFLHVGLEIKREIITGELASFRLAALPVLAALGGMIVPAVIYASFNAGTAGGRGWGIPMATDIAFALGVLALLGSRIPIGLRVFLAALAIVDDLGAVLVIALFYTARISLSPLAGAVAVCIALVTCNRAGVRQPWVYAALGVGLWLLVLSSGVHATIAGVLLALTIPAGTAADAGLLDSMEQRLHGPVAFVIMPLFAFANAGVRLNAQVFGALSWRIAAGVFLGLVLGKMIGIFAASRTSVRAGMARLPANVDWLGVFGASWLGGIGFTMSLFVSTLAFGNGPLLDSAKVGILAASALAALIGGLVLLAATRPRRSQAQQ